MGTQSSKSSVNGGLDNEISFTNDPEPLPTPPPPPQSNSRASSIQQHSSQSYYSMAKQGYSELVSGM
jgi:hypothetical protein